MRRWRARLAWFQAFLALPFASLGCASFEPEAGFHAQGDEAVVLLHGVWRRAGSLSRLAEDLARAGYEVHLWSYRSLTRDLEGNGDWLTERLSEVEADRVHFVTHSMGALVLRHSLVEHPEPRLGRVVMIAPPSRGAHLANWWERVPGYGLAMGRAGETLLAGERGAGAELPPPPGEFAVLAGARGRPGGWIAVVPGDDDGTVGVSETYLPGAEAFRTVHARHTFIMNDPQVRRWTLEFLAMGEMSPEQLRP